MQKSLNIRKIDAKSSGAVNGFGERDNISLRQPRNGGMSPGENVSDCASYIPENQSPIKQTGTIFEFNYEDDEFTQRFEEHEKLGEGGAATVYKVKERKTGTYYAAKVMGNRDADKA